MMKILNFLFDKHKYITMSAIILILVVCITAISFHFFSDSTSKDENETSASQVQSTSNEYDDGVLAGDSTILIVCNGENVGEAMFMGLLDFHIFAQEIVLTPLNRDTSDGEYTYAQSYSYGGIDNLLKSVEGVRKCNIDRYAIIDEDGMCKLTDTMGKVNLYVSEDYTYESSDKSYSVSTGYNDLEASMLYTYLALNSEKENGEKLIADIACTIINSYISNVDLSQTQELFEEVCNCISTDITIADYYTASSDIEYLIKNKSECIVYN